MCASNETRDFLNKVDTMDWSEGRMQSEMWPGSRTMVKTKEGLGMQFLAEQ